MAFLIHSTADGHMPAWEYVPAAAITPKIGLALYANDSNNYAVANATQKPTHICMTEKSAAVSAGDIIPVIAITPDIVFEVDNSASMANAVVGTKVTISNAEGKSGLAITATTQSGTATIVKLIDTAATGTTLVKFE